MFFEITTFGKSKYMFNLLCYLKKKKVDNESSYRLYIQFILYKEK